MSEKRFKVCIDSNNGVGLFDNSVKLLFVKFTNKEDALSCKDSLKHHCNLMNELHNENEQLKKAEKINMEYAEQIVEENQQLRIAKNDLRIENEQLNLAIDDLLTHTSCEEVKKENSDLRQNIKIIKDLLSECDLFSDKATEHDIIAYRELHKFDNKDAYSIACSIAKIKKVINDE